MPDQPVSHPVTGGTPAKVAADLRRKYGWHAIRGAQAALALALEINIRSMIDFYTEVCAILEEREP